jgi:hypothetical protein
VFLGAAAFALAGSPTARADLIVTVHSATADAGSVNNVLEVTLTNTGPAAATIGGFSFGVMTPPGAGVAFTEANISTTTPYLFAGHSLVVPVIHMTTGPSLQAADVFDIVDSGATLAPGQTVGLGRLLFDVAPGAGPGEVPVLLQSFATTSLSTPLGVDLPINALNQGRITIRSSADTVIPEPTSLMLVALMSPVGALLVWRRRSRRAESARAP